MNNINSPTISHIVVDMLYDFIDGSLACSNSIDAVKNAVKYINEHPEQEVLYICDSHPINHCSFSENGGIWPTHCVTETKGGSIHRDFYEKVFKETSRPNKNNIFKKGCDSKIEQYSGFESVNDLEEYLKDRLQPTVIVSGIATEFCINETVRDLKKMGIDVFVNVSALAYVTKEGHDKTLSKFSKSGIQLF